MVDNDRSKLQLESDVRLLYSLLERAKRERRSYYLTVHRLQNSVATSDARAAEVNASMQYTVVRQQHLHRVCLASPQAPCVIVPLNK